MPSQQEPSCLKKTARCTKRIATTACTSFVVVLVVAVVFGHFFGAKKAPPEWHKGERWTNFLSLYDAFLTEMYGGCDWQTVPTTFGNTATFGCGSKTDPVVVFLHGAASNAMIYGDWILPKVAKSHYAIAIDFVCDIGRSSPLEGNVAKCPQTEQQLAQWVKEVLLQLNITKPASLLGYSYGAFIATATAIHESASVDRLVLLAPAGVLAPVEFAWLWRAIVYSTLYAGPWFTKYMAADPNFDYDRDTGSPRHRVFMEALRDVSATSLSVPTPDYDDETLRRVGLAHKTLVILGESETVTDHTRVVETGNRTGIRVEVVPNAGHLMLIEKPAREWVDSRVESWLNSS